MAGPPAKERRAHRLPLLPACIAYGYAICYKISSFRGVMKTEEFDYSLPGALIAQHPAKERTASRLLLLDRRSGQVGHCRFAGITEYLREGDLIVLNDTKVLPARLSAVKETGGAVDILLAGKVDEKRWSCLAGGLRRTMQKVRVRVGETPLDLEAEPGGGWTVELPEGGSAAELMAAYGRMPLPRYIRRSKGAGRNGDDERYQTVYARTEGSIAAPTAGLHFDEALLERIEAQGVNVVKITLHIGTGTFFLIKSVHVEGHAMHSERYFLSPGVLEAIGRTKKAGGRVIAVGTSVVRTLETANARGNGALEGSTDLFIYPGYRFRVVDALVTNFHLPRSTPLMLVCAFAGKEAIEGAYREAVERGYRFYSYGDAMFIS